MTIPDKTDETPAAFAPHATTACESLAAPQTENGPRSAPEALLATNMNPGNGNSAPHPIPGRDGIPIYAVVHGACGKWWTGAERSHCGGCHELFSSLTAFDRHRRGGQCLPPAEVGLVAREKPYGVLWGFPAPEGGYAFHASSQERDDTAEHEATVQAFNAAHPVGTPVLAYPGARPEDHPTATCLTTRTRSAASVLGGHTPVVWVDDHDACIALTHIEPITEEVNA